MVIIIDGNQLACRCYFSMDKLSNSSGKRTETIYGFLNSFRKIVREYKDENSVFFLTWDGGNDRRKSIFSDYKAGRKKFEDAFYEQLCEIRKIIGLLGIKQYHEKATEADDLIGTLTIKSRKKGKKVLIVSSDHDFEQLITRHVEVLHPMGKNIVKDIKFVVDNYGITPDRLVEVMSITGDPTDNIPGIESVGDKTAAKLILANGSLESILSDPRNLKILNRKGVVVEAKEDLKNKIASSIDSIRIANKLVKIYCDLDVEPDFSKQQTDFDQIQKIFEQLEFRQFLNEIDQWKKCFRTF
jgi:DNA polymerase-1